MVQTTKAKEDINLETEDVELSYECEKKPLKAIPASPGDLEYVSELSKGRFSVAANVLHRGNKFSCKVIDKSDSEGDEAAKREFKNLKTLKHEKIVSFNC